MEDSKKVELNPWKSYHTVFTNAKPGNDTDLPSSKSGMEGVDKEKVQKIVYEMSKGSKYFENQERKEAIMMKKIQNMRARCLSITPSYLSHHQMLVDKRIVELEATRDLSRIWLHVDMDAFYAAVETLADPSLKGKPMAVGGMSMISTANYEARKFGVRAAMPGFIARKLCPHLIFVPVDFKKYTYYSDLTRKVFHKYDPNFIAASLDEAYLDITEICKVRGVSGEEITEKIRTSVHEETGLTCSAGVAPNRLLAKVCSDINKPNGQFILPNDRMAIMTFIASLPIRKIGGIGKVTEHILKDVFGIHTCEELLQKSGHLFAFFSRSSAEFFLSVGLGLGQTDAPQVSLRKGISNERTFSATGDEAFLHKKLEELAEMLSTDMGKEGLSGRTLTLKLKTSSFEVRTRAITVHKHICSSEDILDHASKLLKAEFPISLRLIGLRMSHFNEGKNAALSDPAQRTLTNYIVSKSDSERNIGDCSSLGLDVVNHQLMIDDEANLSSDCYETRNYNSNDLLASDLRSGLDGSSGTLSNDIGETKSDGNDIDRPIKRNNNVSDASISWVNGYKCSACGFELPPSFVEERQEHSDFHLAETLQQELCSSSRTPNITQRFIRKDQNESDGKKKKQKTSVKGVNHIPIDCFFVKSSNQNF